MNKKITTLLLVLIALVSCDDKCDHSIIPPITPPIVGTWYNELYNEEDRYSESGTFYINVSSTNSK